MEDPVIQILSTIIFIVGTTIGIVIAIHAARVLAQRLPYLQRLALEQFARQAVRQVEKQYQNQSNPGKKALAQVSVAKLFKSFRLPLPEQEAIDIAIESAVFELPHKSDPPATNG